MFEGIAGFLDVLLRLSVAVGLGGLVGLERRIHGHWADIRTHMMVAMGAATFTVLALSASADESTRDPNRVLQGIAAGIGFLGAGTILKLSDQLEVKGLTTASAIWLAAAVGSAAGMGEYIIGVTATVITVVILAIIRPLEKRLEARRRRSAE